MTASEDKPKRELPGPRVHLADTKMLAERILAHAHRQRLVCSLGIAHKRKNPVLDTLERRVHIVRAIEAITRQINELGGFDIYDEWEAAWRSGYEASINGASSAPGVRREEASRPLRALV